MKLNEFGFRKAIAAVNFHDPDGVEFSQEDFKDGVVLTPTEATKVIQTIDEFNPNDENSIFRLNLISRLLIDRLSQSKEESNDRY